MLSWCLAAALAIALLLVVAGPHRVGDYFTETDFYGAYAAGARALQHGTIDPSRYGVVGPGYEIALALVGLVIPRLFLAAELISLVAVVAGALLWFDLLRRRAGAWLALFALLFLIANPTLFRYGYSATTDALAFALQALALWLLLARGSAPPALAGLVIALAFLTRYSAIALLPAGLVFVLTQDGPAGRRRRAALELMVGFAAPVLPWVLFSLAHGGRLALQLHHNIAYDVFARSQGIPWDTYQKELQPMFRNLWDVIARDPGAVLQRELFNVWDHLRLDARVLLGPAIATCVLAGVLFGAWDGTLRRLWPVWLAAGLLFLSLVPSFYAERYSLPLVPAYAALAATAFASPRLALVWRGRFWLKPALAVLPLALSVKSSLAVQNRVMDQLPVELLECASVLQDMRHPDDRVIARKPHIAFHGGVTALPFPFTKTLPELATYARERRARWLFFSWPEAEMRPDYVYLLDTSGVVPGLIPRAVASGHPAVLYEIAPGFGEPPGWFASDTLRVWHFARARLMIDASDSTAAYTLALIDRARGNYGRARGWLERSMRWHPRDVRSLLLLGEVCLHQDDGARAAQVFARAEQLAPGNVGARIGRGWASLVSRQPREAAELWRPVVAETRDPATLERMIDLYRALGDGAAESEARATLARVRAGS